MTNTNTRVLVVAFAAAALVAACTNTYIYDQRSTDVIPADRAVTLEGEFCTPSTNEVVRPIKILMAMDASQSMSVTDPNGTRAQAVVDLINNLPQEPDVEVAVMLFAGSTTNWVVPQGSGGFEPITNIDATRKLTIQSQILRFAVTGTMPNRDSTDFVKPLSEIFSLVNSDLANTRLMRGDQIRPRYSIIFLSDGQPTNNQDDELLCGDAVKRIRQLKDLADDVQFNAVHVFTPTQPIASSACDFDGGISVPMGGQSCIIPNLPPGSCPLLIVNQNSERLQQMARLGGGNFRDFRNNEPINFLNFRFGQVRRTYVFDTLVASNISAPPGSSPDGGDADSDGLLDEDELAVHNTLPWVADTDGDGFSDGVEVYFAGRGGTFVPDQVMLPDGGGIDTGCPVELRGLDADCDGLLDCDEQIIGTNARKQDSDDDGIPDLVEWRGRSQPSSRDLEQDPDNDQLPTGDEVIMHTDPLLVDTAKLSTLGYRYQVQKQDGIDADGRQCYSFRIDNVQLVPTLADSRSPLNPDGGADLFRKGEGFNDIYISYTTKPSDDPLGQVLVKHFRWGTTRFPVGGIRSPVDGIIRVSADDFILGCPPTQSSP